MSQSIATTNSPSAPELVSAVIPTRYRPALVRRAVTSALAQTVTQIEVIVVIDGPDPQTVAELNQIEDARLRVIELATNGGAAAARNAGVRAATGNWIAFLDDDDEWLPDKIERQLEVARQSIYPTPIVSSRFIARTAKGEFIWPTRLPVPHQSAAEYLFIRNSLFLGEAFLVTPTILVNKELLTRIPLREDLPRHEDLDWLIRASQAPDVGIEFVTEPTAVVNMIYTQTRQSLSNVNNADYSLDWIRSIRHTISPQAYSGFIIAVVGAQAAIMGNWQRFLPILKEAIVFGKVRPFDMFLYAMMWLVPQNLRQQVRAIVAKFKPNRRKQIEAQTSHD